MTKYLIIGMYNQPVLKYKEEIRLFKNCIIQIDYVILFNDLT